jgi:hypothetical protein
MKRYVLLSDSENLPRGVFTFIQSIYDHEPFLLVGAFFHAVNDNMVPADLFNSAAGPNKEMVTIENVDVSNSVLEFETLCNKHQIEHLIHQQYYEWDIEDVIKESRYADLMLVSNEMLFHDIEPGKPNSFVTGVLHNAECPVLIVPENAGDVKRIAIAYDGSKESVHAIKMFYHTFPFFCELPVEINYWVDKTDDEFPDFDYLEEFAPRHFSNLNFRQVFFDQEKYLATWLSEKRDTLLVSGSYHRSAFSTLLRKSFIHDAITRHSSPIFVAHT